MAAQIETARAVATVFPAGRAYKGAMTIVSAWRQRLSILMNEKPRNPWSGGGEGSGGDGGSGGGGPRNPWNMPPGGGRGRNPKPTALDEFLRRARGGGGGGGGGGGFPGLPRGRTPRSLWLIGAGLIIGLWVIFTSFHAIAPQQQGVVAFFGRYSGTLDPGIRMTLPAPIETVTRVDVQMSRTDDFPKNAGEPNMMLTGDQNIINLAYTVRWNISNPQDYLYQIAEPEETVRASAESAMRAVVATVKLDDAIGAGRNQIEQRVQDMTQAVLDHYRAGVRIQGVSIRQADPPEAVSEDFKRVIAAQQEAVGNLNKARTYAQQVIAHAQGEAAQFDLAYAQYKLAPEVTRRRMYYETMEKVLSRTNKTIVEAPGVVPYLPLPAARGKPADQPQQGGAQ
jgi:membrane protease subunit HflK